MEEKHPINDLMDITMSKLKEMVDVNTVMGDPIHTDGVTIIPISRVSYGFGSGGSDFSTKNQPADKKNSFGGGSGAGVSINPIGFLVIKDQGETVRMIPIAQPAKGSAERVIDMLPEVLDKVSAMIPKKDKEGKEKVEELKAEIVDNPAEKGEILEEAEPQKQAENSASKKTE